MGCVERPHLLVNETHVSYFCNVQERLNTTVGSVQEIIELVSKYDWDFDNYLEEDVPAAVQQSPLITELQSRFLLSEGWTHSSH